MIYCPKCNADISDSYQEDDWSVGITGGYYCDACDEAVDDHGYEPMDDDVLIAPSADVRGDKPLGTPISQLSGRPGHDGFNAFCKIARSWGYD